jgi:MerR family mercuric resistance operon transcriptional regulator
MPTHAFTIRKLANAASVGVEAVRYYQRRGLLAEPSRSDGKFRQYTDADVQRLRFIKRAQDLGFSLDDVAELASLNADRDQPRVREITQRRVLEIRARVESLNSLATALEGLANCCARSSDLNDCPILTALAESGLQ